MRITAVITACLFCFLALFGFACAEEKWTCPKCGNEGNTRNFCKKCGTARPVQESNSSTKELKVGDHLFFGRYEQDNDQTNGKEPIEWIVLDVQDGKALLLSRYVLDAMQYNTEKKDMTWEKCTLRKWLNGDFLHAAFTETEQSAVLLTNVDNSKAQGYSEWKTEGGGITWDQVFLLSCAQANKYLDVTWDNSILKACAAPTKYAQAQGAWTSESNKTADGEPAGWWWLRSPGFYQNYAAYVSDDGSLRHCSVNRGNGDVRPALWLNPESEIF